MAGLLACALLAGCITPYGYQYLVETFNVLNLGPVLQQNSEWRPMDADSDYVQETILLVLLALALTFGVKLRFPRVLLVIGFLHFGLKHVRGLPMVALTWPFMLAGPLQNQFAFLRPATDPWPLFGARKSGSFTTIIGVAAAVVAVVILGAAYTRVRPVVNPSPNVSPQAAVDYVLQQNVSGPVFNDFDFGGYLIFRGIKTFIDGRTLPFGKQFAVDYFDAQKIQNLAKLDEMADTYKVTWTLLQTRHADGVPLRSFSALAPALCRRHRGGSRPALKRQPIGGVQLCCWLSILSAFWRRPCSHFPPRLNVIYIDTDISTLTRHARVSASRSLKGHVAEWLRTGLQNRVRRFNSGRGLHLLNSITYHEYGWRRFQPV